MLPCINISKQKQNCKPNTIYICKIQPNYNAKHCEIKKILSNIYKAYNLNVLLI